MSPRRKAVTLDMMHGLDKHHKNKGSGTWDEYHARSPITCVTLVRLFALDPTYEKVIQVDVISMCEATRVDHKIFVSLELPCPAVL
ncbi:hypothetical protein ACLOJK_014501 [Asimina triloba]